ncbi:TetR/AcrR family transcriptional regulator [Hahella aquimaris]|uniref:TetR/AcrR family transcriptional regulator n=1 Tax=Hahella sp. HNIBRBA332 TaxID=3015983 RepID=UPI00273C46B9|nr:TetR/AcrR family transcriptional regulator [Hahella sp. HNIBRBA332]WLQ12586.1 TetR/AcrR family transcriptional regulator [Hahella sp. HNIBRBA332]
MRPVRPPEEVEQLKRNILDVALRLIVQEGFAALTMRRLGKALGMTAPNLYNYYQSKDEIYVTLMIQGFSKLRAYLMKRADAEQDAIARGRAIMRGYIEFGLSQPEHYELMFSSHAPKFREYKGTDIEPLSNQEYALSMEVANFAETCLQSVLDRVGLNASSDQRRTMLIELWSLLHGMVSLHLTGNTAYLTDTPLETYEHILDLLLQRFVDRHREQQS